mmetsp:Transcript_86141/g.229934  ORF Transcript_86141/g.229934 Transcript_86141/m.229934 type:complete len:80 (-) Transcript_86141:862-1101(-)
MDENSEPGQHRLPNKMESFHNTFGEVSNTFKMFIEQKRTAAVTSTLRELQAARANAATDGEKELIDQLIKSHLTASLQK